MTDTRDDGSVEYAVERVRLCAHGEAPGSVDFWSAVALSRIEAGAYRSNAEAGRIAAAAVQRIDERNDEVGRLTCSGDERLMYDTLQRVAALNNSTGSGPERIAREFLGKHAAPNIMGTQLEWAAWETLQRIAALTNSTGSEPKRVKTFTLTYEQTKNLMVWWERVCDGDQRAECEMRLTHAADGQPMAYNPDFTEDCFLLNANPLHGTGSGPVEPDLGGCRVCDGYGVLIDDSLMDTRPCGYCNGTSSEPGETKCEQAGRDDDVRRSVCAADVHGGADHNAGVAAESVAGSVHGLTPPSEDPELVSSAHLAALEDDALAHCGTTASKADLLYYMRRAYHIGAGSEPGETRDGRGTEGSADSGRASGPRYDADAERADSVRSTDLGAPDLTPPSEDGERVRWIGHYGGLLRPRGLHPGDGVLLEHQSPQGHASGPHKAGDVDWRGVRRWARAVPSTAEPEHPWETRLADDESALRDAWKRASEHMSPAEMLEAIQPDEQDCEAMAKWLRRGEPERASEGVCGDSVTDECPQCGAEPLEPCAKPDTPALTERERQVAADLTLYIRPVPRWIAWLLTRAVGPKLPPEGPFSIAFIPDRELRAYRSAHPERISGEAA